MKFDKKFKFLLISALICALLVAACVRSDFSDEKQSDCDLDIQDEDNEMPRRLLLGIGQGAIAAARLRGEHPDRFSLVAGIGGPVSLAGTLDLIRTWLSDYDNFPEGIVRQQRIEFLIELFRAFGNPLTYNADSAFYPPGTTAGDFPDDGTFTPKSIAGITDRLNPDGTVAAVTFADSETGLVIPFALALDENGNGQRDAGEPLIIQFQEDFVDANGNGQFDSDEEYSDTGIDGIAGTFDYGEGNGQFDYSPAAARFYENDLATVTLAADEDVDRYYLDAFYTDLGHANPWGWAATNTALFQRIDAITDGDTDPFCIKNSAATYDTFFWPQPYPVEEPIISERFIEAVMPSDDGEDLNPTNDDTEDIRARRMLQALFFLSARTPNWFLYKSDKDRTGVIYEKHAFTSKTGYKIRYTVGLPAGYNEERSQWETYPVVYVFPDKNSSPEQWRDLLTYQGWLTEQQYAQKVLLVVLDPDAESFGGTGYSYFTGPADPTEGEVDAEALLDEIMETIEAKFRADMD